MKVFPSISTVHNSSSSQGMKMTHLITRDWLGEQERGWRAGGNVETGVFENHQSSDLLGKLLLSSECLNLDSEFTLQTMDPRLMCILAESADQSEESTQLGHFQIKALDVRTEWGIPPTSGEEQKLPWWGYRAVLVWEIQLASSQGGGGADMQLKSGSGWWRTSAWTRLRWLWGQSL